MKVLLLILVVVVAIIVIGSIAASGNKSSSSNSAEGGARVVDTDKTHYRSIEARDYALVVKDPDAHKGEKLLVYGFVSQFDAATGQHDFRANTSAVEAKERYAYSVNTMVTAIDANLLTKVVQNDLVTMYVEVLGSTSYDTQIGGHTTVPHLQVNVITVTGSAP